MRHNNGILVGQVQKAQQWGRPMKVYAVKQQFDSVILEAHTTNGGRNMAIQADVEAGY